MGIENLKINPLDERRNILIPGDKTATLDVAVRHFVSTAKTAIKERGAFFVALSGGSTPKVIYERISNAPYSEEIDWKKVWIFWGDERNVSPESADSNYKMALDAGLAKLPIPKGQIFRMEAEDAIEEHALAYENAIKKHVKDLKFDLVMLGMGDDGHTASLFPQTEALKAEGRIVVANFVPQKNAWRMTLTFEMINSSRAIAFYVIGAGKKDTLVEVLKGEENFDRYPSQRIGTEESKALWIIDEEAASELLKDSEQ